MAASDIDHRPATARSQFLPRLLRSKIAVVSAFILALVFFAAVAAPLIAPHDPAEIHLINRLKPPGFINSTGHQILGSARIRSVATSTAASSTARGCR